MGKALIPVCHLVDKGLIPVSHLVGKVQIPVNLPVGKALNHVGHLVDKGLIPVSHLVGKGQIPVNLPVGKALNHVGHLVGKVLIPVGHLVGKVQNPVDHLVGMVVLVPVVQPDHKVHPVQDMAVQVHVAQHHLVDKVLWNPGALLDKVVLIPVALPDLVHHFAGMVVAVHPVEMVVLLLVDNQVETHLVDTLVGAVQLVLEGMTVVLLVGTQDHHHLVIPVQMVLLQLPIDPDLAASALELLVVGVYSVEFFSQVLVEYHVSSCSL